MNLTKFFIAFIFLAAFSVSSSAQRNPYPNELKDYKLFGNKKLSGLKIGITTKAEITKVFNSICQYECDFDPNWTIRFRFLDRESAFPLKYSAEPNFKPNPKYIGKLLSIILMPKFVKSFTNVRLPEVFEHIGGVGATGTNLDLSVQHYRDSDGLEYELQYETPLTNEGKEIAAEKTISLKSIRYGASNVLAEKMFIKTK